MMWAVVLYAYIDNTVEANKFFKFVFTQAMDQLSSLKDSVLMFKSPV